ncbi:MAG: hypothetical protein QMC73_02780, partial [Myxococcota bacterium]
MAVAYTALAAWFVISLAVYALMRAPMATAVIYIAGNLLLPERIAIDPPLLPDIGKQEVISLAALIAVTAFARQRMSTARIGTGVELMIVIGVACIAFTVFNNSDFIRSGRMLIPGTNPTDIIPDTIVVIIRWAIPFVIARAVFTRARDGRTLMLVFAVAGLFYSVPVIIELIISPQLHKFVYGYMQHSFLQTLRGDGYRPMVFMPHGLNLTFFLVMAVAAAATMWRTERSKLQASYATLTLYLGVILLLCRSTGSTLYALLITPLILFAPPRLQIRVASALAIVVFSYPVLRQVDVIPFEAALNVAKHYAGERRAKSFQSRLHTEETMLERIKERPWFGWASPGRSGVRDPVTGQLDTVYDGYWIIVLGKRGIIGFITTFALLLLPIFIAGRAISRIRAPEDRALLGALSLMIAVSTFDLLPNSTVDNYLTVLSGALAGLVPGILKEQAAAQVQNRDANGVLPRDKQARAASLLGPTPPQG